MRSRSAALLISITMTLAWPFGCATKAADNRIDLVIIGPVRSGPELGAPSAVGLAVDHGRVVALLTPQTLADYVTRARRCETIPDGGVAMPGIIESHAHFLGLGQALRRIDLRDTRSADEVAAKVAAAAATAPAGAWILGRGWNQEVWAERTFPDRLLLDAAAGAHPVALERVDGHATWVNTAALMAAQITDATVAPPGGEILRRSDGSASGILIDNATGLVDRVVPAEGDDGLIERDLLAAQDLCLSLGITTFVDAGIGRRTLEVLETLYHREAMALRIYAMKGVASDAEVDIACATPPVIEAFDGRLTVRALKMYADGALGSRGAWLLEDYADRPGHRGFPVTDPSVLRRAAQRALASGYQLCVHAIGDRGNREVLDAVTAALDERPTADHRFRIEHAQILHPSDIPRFAQLGIIPSMQACHAASDGPWVPDRLGAERARVGAYAWRSLIDSGCVVPNGTDAPVEQVDPWLNLFAALERRHPLSAETPQFQPEQAMDRREALASLTTWGAYGTFTEGDRGRLLPGYRADVVILDRDPYTVANDQIAGVEVIETIVAGAVVYTRGERAEPTTLSPGAGAAHRH